jgi:hypothetical protein
LDFLNFYSTLFSNAFASSQKIGRAARASPVDAAGVAGGRLRPRVWKMASTSKHHPKAISPWIRAQISIIFAEF